MLVWTGTRTRINRAATELRQAASTALRVADGSPDSYTVEEYVHSVTSIDAVARECRNVPAAELGGWDDLRADAALLAIEHLDHGAVRTSAVTALGPVRQAADRDRAARLRPRMSAAERGVFEAMGRFGARLDRAQHGVARGVAR